MENFQEAPRRQDVGVIPISVDNVQFLISFEGGRLIANENPLKIRNSCQRRRVVGMTECQQCHFNPSLLSEL